MNGHEEYMLTSLLDSSERLNIHCTIEVLNHLGQVPLHFFGHLLVRRPADRSSYNPLVFGQLSKTIAYLYVRV